MLEQKYNVPVCAGIVTYNPNPELLLQCVEAIYKQVDIVFIYDNGSTNSSELKSLIEDYKVEIEFSSTNNGISKALNSLCEKAISKGFDWIVTMDQDSICKDNMVSHLVSHITTASGIVAPRVEFWTGDSLLLSTKDGDKDVVSIDACITSGSLTNLKAWDKIGGFDEWMFIDHVDNEFCTHLKTFDYSITRVNAAVLLQRAGEMKYMSLPNGKRILLPYYSPLRHYYSCRNTVYYLRKYRKNINFTHELLAFIYSVFMKLTFESGKIQTIKATYRGIREGLLVRIEK